MKKFILPPRLEEKNRYDGNAKVNIMIKELFHKSLNPENIASSLTMDLEKEKLLKILSNLVAISKLLNYSDGELNDYCIEKMNKTLSMIS